MDNFSTFTNSLFTEPKTATQFRIKKFNRDNQLCYYDSIDLTEKGITEEQLDLFSDLFTRAGFEIEVKTHTYFGIYDPSRMAELIEIYPTDDCEDFKELREVTWSEDRIYDSDLQFVSIDFLREKVEELKNERLDFTKNISAQTDLILRVRVKLLNDIINGVNR